MKKTKTQKLIRSVSKDDVVPTMALAADKLFCKVPLCRRMYNWSGFAVQAKLLHKKDFCEIQYINPDTVRYCIRYRL